MFGNYKYSLRSTEQAEIQEFLRRLPKYLWQTAGWQLLHDLTYAPSVVGIKTCTKFQLHV